jgi:zinc/manganese transport system permease protein
MQRALIGGVLTGFMGGLVGSFTIMRQLSFFSDALGHSALLGISIGVLLGIDPSSVLLPFAVMFAVGVAYLLEKTRLWTDALLNIVYSSSLAAAVIILSSVKDYKGNLSNLLFGDILAVRPLDLWFSAVLLVICIVFIGLTMRLQMLLTLHEPMAIAQGINAPQQRVLFIALLSLIVGISIRAIGVLLVSAFVVIPACAAQLLSRSFVTYVWLAAVIGASSAVLGMLASAVFNWPSGPSIVMAQLLIFITAALVSKSAVALLQQSR